MRYLAGERFMQYDLGFFDHENLIGDKAYDSDQLDKQMREQGTEMIAPHKRTRLKRTQDGRQLRRYERRWIVERFFALDSRETSPLGSLGVLPAQSSRLRAACSPMHPARAVLGTVGAHE